MLTIEETEALVEWMSALSFADVDLFLFRSIHARRSDFTGSNSAMPAVAMDFAGLLRKQPHHAPVVYAEIVRMTPGHARVAYFTETRDRLAAEAGAAAALGPRHAACCPGGVPVIDRVQLRDYLERLTQKLDALGVIAVEGQPGFGRSHSWYLIQHVAASLPDVKALRVDLSGFGSKKQPLFECFRHLTRIMELNIGEEPTVDGVTGATLAERFLDEIRTRILALPAPTHRPWNSHLWLVFDSIDGDRTPLEIKYLVMQLARERLLRSFEGCTIFLLGPDPAVAVEDPMGQVRREVVTAFQPHEIQATAAAINSLGKTPLSPPDLVDLIAQMNGVAMQGRDRMRAVSDLMVGLRSQAGVHA